MGQALLVATTRGCRECSTLEAQEAKMGVDRDEVWSEVRHVEQEQRMPPSSSLVGGESQQSPTITLRGLEAFSVPRSKQEVDKIQMEEVTTDKELQKNIRGLRK